jgi:glycosyltransferase involved in cell wall biosynthesis
MSVERTDVSPTVMLPSVDVVIATHNRPELLRAALDAALAQTYSGRISCVVVFDRSSPDYALECDTPARSVRVVRNTRTAGLAGARNTGIAAGSGDFVAFCDDDRQADPAHAAIPGADLRHRDHRRL